jgi:hypothetical protein
MRAPLASILILVSLTGCLQSADPMSSVKNARPEVSRAAIASQPKLKLSVEVSPRALPTGAILPVTLTVTNLGNEPFPGAAIRLNIDDLDGQPEVEYHSGVTRIGAKQTGIVRVELPPTLDVGMYRFTISTSEPPEKSPPFVFRILPAGD